MNVTTARTFAPPTRSAQAAPQRPPAEDRVDLGERVLDGIGYAANTALIALPGIIGGAGVGLSMTAVPALLMGNSFGIGLATVGTVVGAVIGGAFTYSMAGID